MMDNRQIVAAIELKVKQLRSQNLSDSALLEQMVECMLELEVFWKRTTDEDLEALFKEFPHFQYYASLMGKVSEALPAGGRHGVPTDVKYPTLPPERFDQPVQQLLIQGATLESLLIQGTIDTSEAEARYHQWVAAVKELLARVDRSDLDDHAKREIRQAFGYMGVGIRRG